MKTYSPAAYAVIGLLTVVCVLYAMYGLGVLLISLGFTDPVYTPSAFITFMHGFIGVISIVGAAVFGMFLWMILQLLGMVIANWMSSPKKG